MKRTVIERLDVGVRLLAATPLSKTRPRQLHRHARSGSRLFCLSVKQQAVAAQQRQHDVRVPIDTNAHGLISLLESLASLMETDLGGMGSWVRRLDLAAAALQQGQRQRIASESALFLTADTHSHWRRPCPSARRCNRPFAGSINRRQRV
jgi:hypothetical protein